VRLVRHAKEDTAIKGIYLKCNDDPNGFATNEEIRNAVLDFKKAANSSMLMETLSTESLLCSQYGR